MPRHQFKPGNTHWKTRKRSGGIPGVPHPPGCKHCKAVKTGKNSHKPEWQKKYHKTRRLKKFGLSQNQYDSLIQSQKGVCAICGQKPGKPWFTLAIDHNHTTGEVRGLLCVTCNTRLGFLEKRWTEIMNYLRVPHV